MADEKRDEPRHDPTVPMEELPRWVRGIVGALGVAGLSFGAFAVFDTDNELGSLALLAVGLLLVFVALAGRLPSRLGYQGAELRWASQVYAKGGRDAALEVAEEVKEAAPESATAVEAADRAARNWTAAAQDAWLGAVVYPAVDTTSVRKLMALSGPGDRIKRLEDEIRKLEIQIREPATGMHLGERAVLHDLKRQLREIDPNSPWAQ